MIDPHKYKAPHAYRGTPKKRRKGKKEMDTLVLKNGETMKRLPKLFKGHRP